MLPCDKRLTWKKRISRRTRRPQKNFPNQSKQITKKKISGSIPQPPPPPPPSRPISPGGASSRRPRARPPPRHMLKIHAGRGGGDQRRGAAGQGHAAGAGEEGGEGGISPARWPASGDLRRSPAARRRRRRRWGKWGRGGDASAKCCRFVAWLGRFLYRANPTRSEPDPGGSRASSARLDSTHLSMLFEGTFNRGNEKIKKE